MPNHLLAFICIIICSLCNYNNNNNHKSADETILLNGVFNEADKDFKKSTKISNKIIQNGVLFIYLFVFFFFSSLSGLFFELNDRTRKHGQIIIMTPKKLAHFFLSSILGANQHNSCF